VKKSLRAFVQLVEKHGENKLWAAVSQALETEEGADVVLSTAHKAKGREWNAVRLAPDFMSARLGPGSEGKAEVRLFYVAMTRAKKLLIAEPVMLQQVTSGAWKQNRQDPGSAQRSTEPRQTTHWRQPEPQGTSPITVSGQRGFWSRLARLFGS